MEGRSLRVGNEIKRQACEIGAITTLNFKLAYLLSTVGESSEAQIVVTLVELMPYRGCDVK